MDAIRFRPDQSVIDLLHKPIAVPDFMALSETGTKAVRLPFRSRVVLGLYPLDRENLVAMGQEMNAIDFHKLHCTNFGSRPV